jgi:hypothetical protein
MAMAVQLAIDDGNPWYLSPDIWVVPGDDPDGPPGIPRVGQRSYVWARVHNRGTTSVSNATVRFYWANPATVITPTTATLIGTSFVSLAAGETREVLCLSPWDPVWVNNGHECLIATASAPSDPLPQMGPNDPFTPSTDRHQAQKNLTILAAMAQMFVMPFSTFFAKVFRTEVFTLTARRVDVAGLVKGQPELERVSFGDELDDLEFGISPGSRGEGQEGVGDQQLEVVGRPGTGRTYRLVARSSGKGSAGILIEQSVGEDVVGGLGVILRAGFDDGIGEEAQDGY